MKIRNALAASTCLLSAALSASAAGEFADSRVTLIEAPGGLAAPSRTWIRVATVHSGTMLAAVERPAGDGPFPAVLILHGSHGFAREYLLIAQELATRGFLTIAPCWFRGGEPGDGTVSPPIPCPDAAGMPPGPSEQARKTIADLLATARELPDVHADRIALIGHSRGGGATINYLEHGGNVRAAVVNSAGYPDEYLENAGKIRASMLVLHGMRDSNSEFTSFERARLFPKALRAAHVPELTIFFPHGAHNSLLSDPELRAVMLDDITRFLRRELR